MRIGLYKKIFFWLLLNLVLLGGIAAALAGVLFFNGSNGLFPPYLFSNNVENAFRIISAQCQYKPLEQWPGILAQHGRGGELFYAMLPLDDRFAPENKPVMPDEIVTAAEKMPRLPFTLCPDPMIVLPAYESFTDESGALRVQLVPQAIKQLSKPVPAGLQPTPPVLFMRAGEPPRYWLARALFIPDESQELHYVLLAAASASVTGGGLFFDLNPILGVLLGGLIVSCLWWWPFVRHISRPLSKMSALAEKLAADSTGMFLDRPPAENICGLNPRRNDEIGRLGRSINVMARHLYQTLFRQRRFISHIAQELNLPLARIKQTLAGLEAVPGSERQERLSRIIGEVEHLAVLTDDILNFLRAESGNQAPVFEKVELRQFIEDIIATEAGEAEVLLDCPRNLVISGPARHLGRALANVLRNSLKYAGGAEVRVCKNGKFVSIEILDSGPGVPEEDLPLLGKPFFRSSAGATGGGAGLGLSIVKYCIETCRGTVSFANRKPSGFAVSVRLPLA